MLLDKDDPVPEGDIPEYVEHDDLLRAGEGGVGGRVVGKVRSRRRGGGHFAQYVENKDLLRAGEGVGRGE